MKNNRLLIALVVLIGVGALAITASRSHQAETTLDVPVETLPKLKKDELTEVEIVKPNKQTITLLKQGAGWQVTQPVVGVADTAAVDAVLEKLTTLDVSGVAATRKENHKKLQVDADTAIRVKVKAGPKLVLDLFVGATKGGNTMLRLDGKDVVLAAKGSLRFTFDKEVKQFRDRVITDIPTEELTSMTLESVKGTFRFDKPEAKWQQAAKEKPIPEFSDVKVQSLASTLSRLRAADFADPGINADNAGFSAPTAKVTLTQKSGAVTVIELGSLHLNHDEYHVRVTGKDVLFRISKSTAERMVADATAFVADKPDASKGSGAEPSMMPPGEGAPGGGLPPEIMEQLKRQLATQGGHP